MSMDVDELSDLGGDCVHPGGAREYDGNMLDVEHIGWSVRCSECGEVLAQGADRV